jgi:probable dihydroxyacetone kinase regulator
MDILLADSFKELVIRQPIEKITIKEITDRAGVIRPTFYNHFQDKYELLEWIITEQQMKPLEPLMSNGLVNEALLLLFTNLEKEKEFYMKASRLEGQNSFSSIAQTCVERLLLQVIEKASTGKQPRYPWLTNERVAQYYAQSMCYVAITWIQTGMTIPARELADTYRYILDHSMEDILAEM